MLLDEPISPELCLVSPELAALAREKLPEPEPAPVAVLRAPRPSEPVVRAIAKTPKRRRRIARPLVTLFAGLTAFVGLLALYPGQIDQRVSEAAVRVPAKPAPPRIIVVPNACGQAYVFVKGVLEEAGFSWTVTPAGRGYSSDLVVGQSPLPGTSVVDTGAPTIVLTLAANPAYAESGAPDPAAPYPGTPVKVASRAPAETSCT